MLFSRIVPGDDLLEMSSEDTVKWALRLHFEHSRVTNDDLDAVTCAAD